ncbi:MAG TPA: hypothetical protein VGU90_12500, partial [Terriglobales bacterium]|nr:hypothetical protein [Terriglobales bacterium]
TADLDDGFEARLLTLDQIKEAVPIFATISSEVEKLYPRAPKKLQFNEVLRRILDRWVGDLIRNTQRLIEELAVERSSGTREPGLRPTLDDIRVHPHRLARLSPEVETERRQTKEFLYKNLYYCPDLQPEKEDAERIISQLFDLWMKQPEKLPASYQEKAASEPLARIVCDYIAGMTDTYITEQYEKHCALRVKALIEEGRV